MAKKILVVDDSQTVRQQVETVLSAAGFQVLSAADGMAGSEVIDATPDLNLVICDVNMPRMSGLEMVALVKSKAQHAALPIVMLTTESQPGMIQQAKAAGAKGWIVKPFDPKALVMTAQKLAG
jgi:two-component system, chemotaxis family, chemotaxis protein CheY